MALSESQKKHLRTLAHPLKPVVLIGQNGLTENVLNEIEGALKHHELIKVKVAGAEREDKKAMFAAILEQSKAEEVMRIGHILTLFRRNREKPRIELPK